VADAQAAAEALVADALAEHVSSERLAAAMAQTAVRALTDRPDVMLRLAHPERYR
jgi:hypothetical protein